MKLPLTLLLTVLTANVFGAAVTNYVFSGNGGGLTNLVAADTNGAAQAAIIGLQPTNIPLTTLINSNGQYLTNLPAGNLVGTEPLAVVNPKVVTNGSSSWTMANSWGIYSITTNTVWLFESLPPAGRFEFTSFGNANQIRFYTDPIYSLGYVPITFPDGIVSSFTGNGSGLINVTAANGWPVQWPWASITNQPAIPTTNNLAVTNGTYPNMTVGTATTASGGWPTTTWATNTTAGITNALGYIPVTNTAAGIAAAGGLTNPPSGTAGRVLTAISSTTYAWSNAPSGGSGTLTNNYTFTTTSNPTNQYVITTLYTNLTGYRALLVGSAYLTNSAGTANSSTATIIAYYTNSGVGFSLPISTYLEEVNGATVVNTKINYPFSIPLNTNATFKFILTKSGSASGYITNTVLWAMP